MTVQNVSCFSEAKISATDTFPGTKADLKTLTEAAVRGQTSQPDNWDCGVAWVNMTAGKYDKPDYTACHACFDGRKSIEFVMNVIRWDVHKLFFSDGFQRGFAEWMLDPKESLWKEAMENVVILRNDNGKPLATLWLNPDNEPTVPLVHFCISGPRFLTEWGYNNDIRGAGFKAAEPIYDACGNYTKAYVGGHVTFVGLSAPRDGHKGLDVELCNAGVPKGVADRSYNKDKGRQYSIWVNAEYSDDYYPWKTKPTKPEDYSACWDEAIAVKNKRSKS